MAIPKRSVSCDDEVWFISFEHYLSSSRQPLPFKVFIKHAEGSLAFSSAHHCKDQNNIYEKL